MRRNKRRRTAAGLMALLIASSPVGRADWDGDGKADLVIVKNGSRTREIHVPSGASNFQQYCTQTETGLHTVASSEWVTQFADWDGDKRPDMFAFRITNTVSGFVEVHVYSHASGFRNCLLHAVTGQLCFSPLGGQVLLTNADGDNLPDMAFIHRNGKTATEAFVYTGRSNFATPMWTVCTGLPPCGPGTVFDASSDFDGDGKPDLAAIMMIGAATVEMHVYSAASAYNTAILHCSTAFEPAMPGQGRFAVANMDNDSNPDLVYIKRHGVGDRVEVHALSGASGYKQFVLHATTCVQVGDDEELFISNSLFSTVANVIGIIGGMMSIHDHFKQPPPVPSCPPPKPSTPPSPNGPGGSGGKPSGPNGGASNGGGSGGANTGGGTGGNAGGTNGGSCGTGGGGQCKK